MYDINSSLDIRGRSIRIQCKVYEGMYVKFLTQFAGFLFSNNYLKTFFVFGT